MPPSSCSKGEIAVIKIQLECAKRNIIVSFPSVEGTRYDAILDYDKRLYKAQIKYVNSIDKKGRLYLKLGGSRSYNKKPYMKEEIDILLIFAPCLDKILYLNPKQFHNKKRVRINLTNKKAPTYYENYLW